MKSNFMTKDAAIPTQIVVAAFFILLFAISLQSANAAASGSLVKLSNTNEASTDPQITASGNNVYVAWTDNSDIFFKKITMSNGTLAYGDTVSLDDNNEASTDPQITASGNNVYVAWSTTTNNDILFAASTDNGSSFGDTVNLSNDTISSAEGKLFASGNNVYVAWTDNSDIFFKKITMSNGTLAYGDTVSLDDNNEASTDPQITASGNNVYVAWSTTTNNDILFAASTDNGSSFGSIVNVSNDSGSSVEPRIVASGANAYIVWRDDTEILFKKATIDGDSNTILGDVADLSSSPNGSFRPSIAISPTTSVLSVIWEEFTSLDTGESDIFFRKITNSGTTFGDAINISHNVGNSVDSHVGIDEVTGNVFLIWTDDQGTTNNEIFSSASLNGGGNFGCPINISNSPENSLDARQALVGSDPIARQFVVMEEVLPDFSSSDIFLQNSIDYQAKFIHIFPPSNLSPTWGTDSVSISGSVINPDLDDIVVVNWGDGNSDQTTISGCSWGPIQHTYSVNAISSNPIQIVAKMVDNSGNQKAPSDPVEVIVKPHTTSLTLDKISTVKQGENLTVTGSIIDESAGAPLGAKIITFDGTGALALPVSGVLSSANGSFVAKAQAQNATAVGLTVMVHFAGDSSYAPSESGPKTYDTISSSAIAFSVKSGQNSNVILDGFNASVQFQNVVDNGTIFVANCDPPESIRYLPLGCLEVSSEVNLGEASGALLNISYGGKVPQDGTSASQIDIFHETSPATVVDITHGRNTSSSTVTGDMTSSGKFILGVALHGTKSEGAIWQQVFFGTANEISLRDIENKANSTAIFSLDKTSYLMTDTPVLTVSDPEGNLNANSVDIVSAGVISETSRHNNSTDGITLVLHETDPNTGVFKASFTFTSGNSSGTALQANSGDRLTIVYNIGARASVFINGIAESGIIQINDYSVEQTAQFMPLGGSVNLTQIDGKLSTTDANVTVVMSYANAPLLDNEEEFLRILQRVGDGAWIDITKLDSDQNNIGVDKISKTLTGRTGSLGSFSIGVNVGKPGGAGGGLARPGTGVVLDFVATLLSPTPHPSSTGGHSSNRGLMPISNQVAEGSGVDVKATISQSNGPSGDTVNIGFEKVISGGQLVVTSKSVSELGSIFESTTQTGGEVAIDGGHYATAGSIFDIDASKLTYSGSVNVTIPYDEAMLVTSGGGGAEGSALESDVRFLHYNGSAWQDVTININTTANTVTGRVSSLSPVVAAVIDDGTLGPLYLEHNPLGKFVVLNAAVSGKTFPVADTIELSPGENVTVSGAIKNMQRIDQTYAFIVQITDKNGVVTGLSWSTGVLGRGASTEISKSLTTALEESGSHTIKIFVWTGFENPSILSKVTIKHLDVK